MKLGTILRAAAAVLCLAVLAVSLWQIGTILADYRAGQNAYAELEQYTAPAPTAPPIAAPQSGAAGAAEAEPEISFPQVDFDALRAVNPDVVGWITCEGTAINYPIAQAADNFYYLDHLFGGGENKAGCIFLDCANSPDFSNAHSIVYGHHMKNGTMFQPLVNYKKQEYYDAHPRMLLMTPQQNYTIEIFAGYVAAADADAWRLWFATDEDLEAWLQQSVASSCFTSTVTPAVTDRIITLSTCTYEFDDARFVLLGVLKEQG